MHPTNAQMESQPQYMMRHYFSHDNPQINLLATLNRVNIMDINELNFYQCSLIY